MRREINLKKLNSYRASLAKYGVSPRALKWKTKEAALVRYRELFWDLDIEGKSILDVGCGFGDIINFLKSKTNNFSYFGIDLVPEFIEIARRNHPEANFVIGDFFSYKFERSFDIVVCCGALNSALENLESRFEAIKKMFSLASWALSFNMAGNHPQPLNKKGGRVYYVDSLEVLNFCFSLTSNLIFRHHYREKDFTIVMFKK